MNNEAARRDFDLSRNKSLRTLETTAASVTKAGDNASGFLEAVLSTVTSPLPLDVVVTHRGVDVDLYVCAWAKPIRVRRASPNQVAKNILDHSERFKVFREMYRVKEFRLVLCVDVPDCIAERALRALERIVEVQRTNGGLDHLCELLVISEVRSPCPCPGDGDVGCAGEWPVPVSTQ